MPGFSTYAQEKLLDHLRGKTAFPMPTVWVALYTVSPTDNGGGTEANYTGYARTPTTGADWAPASGTAAPNANPIGFPQCTAGSNDIVAFGLLDAPTAGNLLGYAPCSLPIRPGITPSFGPGKLNVTLD